MSSRQQRAYLRDFGSWGYKTARSSGEKMLLGRAAQVMPKSLGDSFPLVLGGGSWALAHWLTGGRRAEDELYSQHEATTLSLRENARLLRRLQPAACGGELPRALRRQLRAVRDDLRVRDDPVKGAVSYLVRERARLLDFRDFLVLAIALAQEGGTDGTLPEEEGAVQGGRHYHTACHSSSQEKTHA
jgi:hypothetical protein